VAPTLTPIYQGGAPDFQGKPGWQAVSGDPARIPHRL